MSDFTIHSVQHPNPPEKDTKYDGDSTFSSTILSTGWRSKEGARALEAPLIFDKNVQIPMRDGLRLYADILRPQSDEKVPVILVYSPYGKTGRGKCSVSTLT
jgi:predicted acyl esterase